MRKQRVRCTWIMGLLAMLVCSFVLCQEVEAEGQLAEADPAKGITYIYEEENLEAVNLNGNSVIIREAESDKTKITIFIDKNGNGIVDNGEVGEEYESVPVYGVYREKMCHPISIIVESGSVPIVTGLYEGEADINIEEGAAITIQIKNGQILSAFGARASELQVSGNYGVCIKISGGSIVQCGGIRDSNMTVSAGSSGTGTAIDMDISGGNIGTGFGSSNSNIDVSLGLTALDLDIIGSPVITDTMHGIYGGVKEAPVSVKGDVLVDCIFDELPDEGTNLNSLRVIGHYVNFEGNLFGYVDKVSADSVYMAEKDSHVTGNVTFESGEDWKGLTIYGLQGSTIDGNLQMDVYGGKEPGGRHLCAVDGKHSEKEYSVKENVALTYKGGSMSAIYGCHNKAWIKGTLVVDAQAGAPHVLYGADDSTIEGNVEILTSKTVEISTLFGCSDSSLGENLEMNIEGADTNYATFYGNRSSQIKGDLDIHIKSGGYGTLFGACDGTVEGNYTVTVANITADVMPVTRNTNIGGTATIALDTVSGINDLVALSGGEITGAVDITFKNIIGAGTGTTSAIRGVSGSTLKNNLKIVTEKNNCERFWGISDGNIAGNVTILSNGDTGTGSGNEYYGVNGGDIGGRLLVQLTDCSWDSFFGSYRLKACDKVDIIVDGGSYTPTFGFRPCNQSTSSENVDVLIRNVTFPNADTVIQNNPGVGQLIKMVVEDCTVNGKLNVNPDTMDPVGGGCMTTYDGDLYYRGSYPVTESAAVKNIYFGLGAKSVIPKGITLTAQEQIYIRNAAGVLVEGTLSGTINKDQDYMYGAVYVNGGTLVPYTEDIDQFFYPIKIECAKEKGTVDVAGYSHFARPGVVFGRVGQEIDFGCIPKEGYEINEVTVKQQGDELSMVLNKEQDGKYRFMMEAKPAVVTVSFVGEQVEPDKSEKDPEIGTSEIETPEVGAPAKNTQLTDSVTKAVYRVTKQTKTVEYVKPNDKKITVVTIPDTVTIDGVTYQVTAIGKNAFKNNKKLKKLTIGKNVSSIGASAFQNCTSLKKVTLPAKVESIKNKAFYGCKKLTNITVKTTKLTGKKVGSNAFKKAGSSNYKKLTVKVPKKKLKAYKTLFKKKGLHKKSKIKK